jgi:hypothetical protein
LSWPVPQPGLVIWYSYLWEKEARKRTGKRAPRIVHVRSCLRCCAKASTPSSAYSRSPIRLRQTKTRQSRFPRRQRSASVSTPSDRGWFWLKPMISFGQDLTCGHRSAAIQLQWPSDFFRPSSCASFKRVSPTSTGRRRPRQRDALRDINLRGGDDGCDGPRALITRPWRHAGRAMTKHRPEPGFRHSRLQARAPPQSHHRPDPATRNGPGCAPFPARPPGPCDCARAA